MPFWPTVSGWRILMLKKLLVALVAASCGPLFAADVPVNAEVEGPQSHPDVALAPGGEMMVVWHSDGPSNGPDFIQARFFGADGAAVGPEFRINTDNLRGQ